MNTTTQGTKAPPMAKRKRTEQDVDGTVRAAIASFRGFLETLNQLTMGKAELARAAGLSQIQRNILGMLEYQAAEEKDRVEVIKSIGFYRRFFAEIAARNQAVGLVKRRRHLSRTFTPPQATWKFLMKLNEATALLSLAEDFGEPTIARPYSPSDEEVLAYQAGCREGYIEGRLADLAPRRERSKALNARKRQKLRPCGQHMMTLDERDAAIVAEFPVLRQMLGSMEAQQRLAEKYGPLTREMIGVILRKARRQVPK